MATRYHGFPRRSWASCYRGDRDISPANRRVVGAAWHSWESWLWAPCVYAGVEQALHTDPRVLAKLSRALARAHTVALVAEPASPVAGGTRTVFASHAGAPDLRDAEYASAAATLLASMRASGLRRTVWPLGFPHQAKHRREVGVSLVVSPSPPSRGFAWPFCRFRSCEAPRRAVR
jgi:hypothetical protein